MELRPLPNQKSEASLERSGNEYKNMWYEVAKENLKKIPTEQLPALMILRKKIDEGETDFNDIELDTIYWGGHLLLDLVHAELKDRQYEMD